MDRASSRQPSMAPRTLNPSFLTPRVPDKTSRADRGRTASRTTSRARIVVRNNADSQPDSDADVDDSVDPDADADADADENSDYVVESDADDSPSEVEQYQSFLHERGTVGAASTKGHSSIRVRGGRAAVTKRVSVNLDSDDEIIKDMKDKGFKDREIQKRLIEEGRTKYAEKSITTRYNRIQKALQLQETTQLDDELTDWHEGDDEVLDEARIKFQPMYEKAVANAEANFWINVAKEMHEVQKRSGDGKIRFSNNACRDRYTARDNGTAKPVFERDPDQQARKAAHDARLIEIQEKKDEETAERERIEAEQRQKQDAETSRIEETTTKHLSRQQAKEQRAQRRLEAAEQRAARNREKKDRAQKRKEEREERQNARQERMANNDTRKRSRKLELEDRRNREKEERERRKMEAELADAERQKSKLMADYERKKNERDTATLIRRVLHENLDQRGLDDGTLGLPRARTSANTVKTDRKSTFNKLPGSGPSAMSGTFEVGDDEPPKLPQPGKKGAEKNTAFLVDPPSNPRWAMSAPELRILCDIRGVEFEESYTKRALVQALMSADNKLTVNKVREFLKERKLPYYGDKSDVIFRLAADDADQLAKGSEFNAGLKKQVSSGISKRIHSPTPGDVGDGLIIETTEGPSSKRAKVVENSPIEIDDDGQDGGVSLGNDDIQSAVTGAEDEVEA